MENVVNVVSVVSQNRILPKNRYLFLLSQSPVFVLFKVPFSSFSKLVRPVQNPLSSSQSHLPSSESLSHPPPSPVPSPLRPLPSSQSPLPSSSKPKKTAERHEAVPPFAWWLVVGSKMEHSSPHPLLGTTLTREPRRWHSRLLLLRPIWRRPHWCQG